MKKKLTSHSSPVKQVDKTNVVDAIHASDVSVFYLSEDKQVPVSI